LPQERYNAQWLREQGIGIALNSYRKVDEAVRALISGNLLAPMRDAAGRIRNQAVFEIPAILEQLLMRP